MIQRKGIVLPGGSGTLLGKDASSSSKAHSPRRDNRRLADGERRRLRVTKPSPRRRGTLVKLPNNVALGSFVNLHRPVCLQIYPRVSGPVSFVTQQNAS